MRTATLPGVVKPALNPYARQAAEKAAADAPIDKPVRDLRRTLLVFILLLTFEGLLRKLEPNKIGVAIFLLKDVVILFMVFQIMTRHKLPSAINFISIAYLIIGILFLPNILLTGGNDPILAIFGAKEYLLYPVVALAVFVAFYKAGMAEITGFARQVSFLMIPTGLLAIVQTQISPGNWLNLSVDGQSLEDFSSAGHLRVSSSFSFVAQFCSFLNMQMFMSFLALHGYRHFKRWQKLLFLAPIPLLVVCSLLTGSRGAVIGNGAILVIAVGLACLRLEIVKLFRFAWIGALLIVVVLTFQAYFPSLMETYSVREKGQIFGVSDEVRDRVWNSFFSWTKNAASIPFFGNGLGIMSNGSDSISFYARTFRLKGWTETDIASTFFEGGYYLVFVWYAFRLYIIAATTGRFLLQTRKEYFLQGAFCQAFIILVGLIGTLGIQPPIAIWWWLAVGMSALLWWRSTHPLAEDGIPLSPPLSQKRSDAPATAIRPTREPAVETRAGTRAVPVSRKEPVTPPVAPAATETPAAPRLRGRSAYADRLHREK